MRDRVCQVRIDSYFSLPTDLAGTMHTWPEFVRGEEYSVELATDDEQVVVFMVEPSEGDHAYMIVRGDFGGRLFLLVLGAVTYALAADSDEVIVMHWESPDAGSRGA